MEIEYDPFKQRITLQERGLDMSDTAEVFDGPNLTFEDIRFDYGENRFVTVGYMNDKLVVLAWTFRGKARRIISLRQANKREKKTYAPRF